MKESDYLEFLAALKWEDNINSDIENICGKLFDYMEKYWVVKNKSVPWKVVRSANFNETSSLQFC